MIKGRRGIQDEWSAGLSNSTGRLGSYFTIVHHEARHIPVPTSGLSCLGVTNTILQGSPSKGASKEGYYYRCCKHWLCNSEWRVCIPKKHSSQHCADLCRTKGGAGGPTTTVSTLPQLSAAAAVSGPLVIVVQGAISGAAKVSVTSDKTIVGKAGSCESTPIHIFTMICPMNYPQP